MEENTKYILLGVGVLLLILILFAFQGTGATTKSTGAFLMGDSTRYIAPEDNVQASLTGTTSSGSTIINNIFDTNGGTASNGLALVSATDTNTQTAGWTNSTGAYLQDLNMNGNSIINAVDVNSNNVYADTNIFIGANGYIYDNGSEIIIGRR